MKRLWFTLIFSAVVFLASFSSSEASCVDGDQDGYGIDDGVCTEPFDCDDSNPLVNPGATEVCNGIDDNCDGYVDEGFDAGLPCTVGIGICETQGTLVCTADGLDTECDAVPGLPETEGPQGDATCTDGFDNDCDGQSDGEDPACAGCTDNDGDGYGIDDGVCTELFDCDDSDPDVNPGAIEDCNETQTCSDGIDNDCDGKVDMRQNTCLSWCMPVQASTVETEAPSDSKLVNLLAILLAPFAAVAVWKRIRRCQPVEKRHTGRVLNNIKIP